MAPKKSASRSASKNKVAAPDKSRIVPQDENRVILPGSERAPWAGADAAAQTGAAARVAATPASSSGRITVSVIVKRKQPINASRLGKARMTRAEFRRQHSGDPAAVKVVRAFAKEFGLAIGEVNLDRRTIQLTGAVAAMQRAFGVTLVERTMEGKTYRVREGGIRLPRQLADSVDAVLGLDNRPQAKPHFRVFDPRLDPEVDKKTKTKPKPGAADNGGVSRASASAADVSYTPVQVADLYQFPQGATAAGETIGIIELGGGYRVADLSAYFKTLGQPAPQVTAVSVDNGKNSPGSASGPDGEVMLDIEVAAAVAPGAKIVVYFAPNTDQGFVDAITTAVHDTANKPSVVSISWGGPESSWTQQAMSTLDDACQSAAALGITITVAAGDNGASDGATGKNVDFPASSPHVLACGGTTLDGSGTTISSEVVWDDLASGDGATGGGVSNVFALPTWQASANVPKPSGSSGGRGVPDVAGDADPATGYQVRVDGQTMVIGGTSAVAPLWAGLIALNNQQNAQTAGLLQPQIYAAKAKPAFRDITSGNNGGFSAGPGWDACTGLGSPIGTKLIQLLGAAAAEGAKKAAKKTSVKSPRGKR